jgi:lipase maturation factor 1
MKLLVIGFVVNLILCVVCGCRADRVRAEAAVMQVVLWGYRWLLFRIMMGAGLIKIRGVRESRLRRG